MKTGLVVLVSFLLVGALLMGGCSRPSQTTTPYTVKLGQSIIDKAIDNIKDSTSWGLGILDVNINLLTGIAVEGAVVLHNGDDATRIINLAYTPLDRESYNTGAFVPVTSAFRQYVKLGLLVVRLAPMETKTVSITVYIPNGTKDIPDKFTFGITAQGLVVINQTITMDITTEATTTDSSGSIVPDDFLEVTLASPPIDNKLASIVSVTSSLEEDLKAVSYNPNTMVLRVEGLTPSSTRTVTLTYEMTQMVAIAYTQQWYITMIK